LSIQDFSLKVLWKRSFSSCVFCYVRMSEWKTREKACFVSRFKQFKKMKLEIETHVRTTLTRTSMNK